MKSLHELGITDLNDVIEPGTYTGLSNAGGDYPAISNIPDGTHGGAGGSSIPFRLIVERVEIPEAMGVGVDSSLFMQTFIGFADIVSNTYKTFTRWSQTTTSSINSWGSWLLTGGVQQTNTVVYDDEDFVLKYNANTTADQVDEIRMQVSDSSAYAFIKKDLTNGNGAAIGVTDRMTNDTIQIRAYSDNVTFAIGSKSVDTITDDASSGNTSALATAKGVTSEDALVQLVFNSTSTPKASATQYGVAKFASDEDFKAYMGIS